MTQSDTAERRVVRYPFPEDLDQALARYRRDHRRQGWELVIIVAVSCDNVSQETPWMLELYLMREAPLW